MRKVAVICVNVGNYEGRGQEYVKKLAAGVKRHMPEPYDFWCITDEMAVIPGVKRMHAMPRLEGWWQKMVLFRPEIMPDAERIIYMDLDTVITGDLTRLAQYDGPFAMLTNFYDKGLGSGLMAWTGGWGQHLWEAYEKAGYPQNGGDQDWIAKREPGAARLQDVVGGIVSYKVHVCKSAGHELPPFTSIVCFHGRPRPHEVNEGWMRSHWRV